nr:alkaline phosphatase [Salinimonas marina]
MVDWCAHENDIACMLKEMEDFEQASRTAIQFAKQHPDTLVVITGDHETGGLSLPTPEAWNTTELAKISGSIKSMVAHLMKISPQELAYGSAAIALSLEEFIQFELSAKQLDDMFRLVQSRDSKATTHYLKSLINDRTKTGWATNYHTSQNIPVYSYGPGSEKFSTLLGNDEVGRLLMSFVR